MNREPTNGIGQSLPGRRQFLSALGTGAGLACAAGLPVASLGAESTSASSKRVLLEVLAAAGKPAQVVTNPDGTEVVLLPYGGRVLGLFAKGSEENFYWTHPALRAVETAKAFYAGTDWHNSGGDRTWLAPEVDVFLPGRIRYLFEQGRRWTLIIRNFVVNPSGEYVDVPWDDPGDLGYSTQACNVNSGLGQFSELEYHIPAIGGSTSRVRCEDAAQVWAFRGSEPSILHIMRRLVVGDRFVP